MPNRQPHVAPVLAVLAAVCVGLPHESRAQARPLERAEYQVKAGVISARSGVMEVVGRGTVDGHDADHAVLGIQGAVGPAKVTDRFESWIDAAAWADQRNVVSRRFVQDQHGLTKRRQRAYGRCRGSSARAARRSSTSATISTTRSCRCGGR